MAGVIKGRKENRDKQYEFDKEKPQPPKGKARHTVKPISRGPGNMTEFS